MADPEEQRRPGNASHSCKPTQPWSKEERDQAIPRDVPEVQTDEDEDQVEEHPKRTGRRASDR